MAHKREMTKDEWLWEMMLEHLESEDPQALKHSKKKTKKPDFQRKFKDGRRDMQGEST